MKVSDNSEALRGEQQGWMPYMHGTHPSSGGRRDSPYFLNSSPHLRAAARVCKADR